VGAKPIHADRQTDGRDKANRQFPRLWRTRVEAAEYDSASLAVFLVTNLQTLHHLAKAREAVLALCVRWVRRRVSRWVSLCFPSFNNQYYKSKYFSDHVSDSLQMNVFTTLVELPEEPTVPLPEFYGTWRIITVFTIARQLSLCGVRWIQSHPPHSTSLRSILLMLSREDNYSAIVCCMYACSVCLKTVLSGWMVVKWRYIP
jgi:hypothetical protein